MRIFDLNDIEFLNHEFASYIEEQVSPGTFKAYKRVIENYLTRAVLNRIESNDYRSIFEENSLQRIERSSSAVRPALLKFLDFLRDTKFIEEDIDYLKAKNNIETSFSGTQDRDTERDLSLLTPNEIRNLFSDKITFKSDEEAKLVPLLCSLSFFCMLKQTDILRLTVKDIDLKNKRLRNVRINDEESSILTKWIELDDITCQNLKSYLNFRDSINPTTEFLMVDKQGSALENSKINSLFNSLKRTENKHLFNGKSFSHELLIKSMMLYILTSTNGSGIYQILLGQEPTADFKYALNEYLSILRDQSQNDYVKNFSLNEILPIKREGNSYTIKPTITVNSYSEEYDVNEVDLKMYDENMINKQNLQENKITIQRMVRNSTMANKLKEQYENKCQLCKIQIRKANGEYSSEAHHIKPYNKIHRGDDTTQNLIVLCPNCHTQFDDLYFAIHPETQEIHCIFEDDDYHLTTLIMIPVHTLGRKYLEYTWGLFEEKKEKLRLEKETTGLQTI